MLILHGGKNRTWISARESLARWQTAAQKFFKLFFTIGAPPLHVLNPSTFPEFAAERRVRSLLSRCVLPVSHELLAPEKWRPATPPPSSRDPIKHKLPSIHNAAPERRNDSFRLGTRSWRVPCWSLDPSDISSVETHSQGLRALTADV